MTDTTRFWENKALNELSQQEWELLCDGCGYCCLVKLEDEDEIGAVYTTSVSCRLLDTETCRCSDYPNRVSSVPTCMVIDIKQSELFEILPETCAYRLLYEGKKLYDWHPLLSHNRVSVREAGVSVCAYAVSEEYIHPDELEDHILHRIR